ncbi:MAG: hypothetical protein V4592_24140 [Bacteroidota bacterium]
MKKTLLLLTLTVTGILAKAQTAMGPVEKRLTDSICNCVAKLDMAKITTKQQAIEAYSNCVAQHADLLPDLAAEKKVNMEDQDAMRTIGIELAKNLMRMKCDGFIKLSVAMAKKDNNTGEEKVTTADFGTFKRIDLKGFNYLVIADKNGNEKSYLWLRQFNGSEKLMAPTATLAGKRLKISSQEIEVYLPAAKGYFKVKEITGVEVL